MSPSRYYVNWTTWVAALLTLLMLCEVGRGEPLLQESYESPTPSWKQPKARGATRVISQRRVRLASSGGPQGASRALSGASSNGAELVRFSCPLGYSGVFYHPLGRAPVLEEFGVSLKMLTEIPGAQLAVRVVFPRSIANRPGAESATQAAMTVVRGPARYEKVGQWQQLHLTGLPKLVQRQARLLRARPEYAGLDEREAYVDRVLVVVPGEPRGTNFWTDELVVDGVLQEAQIAKDESANTSTEADSEDDEEGLPLYPVTVSARGFLDREEQLFPRICSSGGGSLEEVGRLGFTALALDTPPSPEQWEAAAKAKLRILCPPADDTTSDTNLRRVLAWVLAEDVDAHSLDAVRPTLERVQADHRLASRPIIAKATYGFAAWSRTVSGLALRADRQNFAESLARTRPGTPALARISLTVSPQLEGQLRALAATGNAQPWRDPRQIEQSIWAAVAAGAKGIWLEASSPLSGSDEPTEQMAATVQLINHKLAMIEPWLTGGEAAAAILGPRHKPIATILQRDRTKLVIGYGSPDTAGRAVTIPGIPESATLLSMSPGGLSPLSGRRVAGGTAIDSALIAPGAFLLITEDPQAIRTIARRIAKNSRRAVSLEQRLATRELDEWTAIATDAFQSAGKSNLSSLTANVKRLISQSQAALSGGDAAAAYRLASGARSQLASVRRQLLRTLQPGGAGNSSGRLDSSPLIQLPATWPDEIRLRRVTRALPRGPNLLAGGNFESLEAVRQVGWRHTVNRESRLEATPAKTKIQFLAAKPRYGQQYLEFVTESDEPAEVTAGSRVRAWITSPAIPLSAGQLVEVTGWVRIDAEDGPSATLEISDSLGGDELAVEVDAGSQDWRPFRLLRRSTKGVNFKLNFAFSGNGKAAIDAVMVRTILTTGTQDQRTNPPATTAIAPRPKPTPPFQLK